MSFTFTEPKWLAAIALVLLLGILAAKFLFGMAIPLWALLVFPLAGTAVIVLALVFLIFSFTTFI